MPTGRPDYWYGTALYFEDSPADGEVTRGPTSNWAYDHKADVDAHHAKYTDAEAVAAVEAIVDDTPVDGATDQPISSNWAFDHDATADAHHAKYTDAEAVTAMGAKADANPLHHDKFLPEEVQNIDLGKTRELSEVQRVNFFTYVTTGATGYIQLGAGLNTAMVFYLAGTNNFKFYLGGAYQLEILNAGGLSGCWDDTPTNGETTRGVTSDWAYDHVNDADAHHAPPSVFVDRGDPADYDWEIGDITADATWRDLDCSSVVPAGAIAILFHGYVKDGEPGKFMGLRKNGNENEVNYSVVSVQVADVYHQADMLVACDANRVVEYLVSADTDAIGLCIRGWWI